MDMSDHDIANAIRGAAGDIATAVFWGLVILAIGTCMGSAWT